ncbi:unnamed protein product [Adineta ricciae]|uniref:Uncharacterized protein n=1 Tax=Adineta ricciae TaxID=249248 RepID=A0A815WI90_ADIRI|nr:unnamed protein product [Adineta ricciae]
MVTLIMNNIGEELTRDQKKLCYNRIPFENQHVVTLAIGHTCILIDHWLHNLAIINHRIFIFHRILVGLNIYNDNDWSIFSRVLAKNIILLLYNSLATVSITETIKSPSFDEYEQLYEKYPQTLTCPCKKILIDYEHILDIHYELHQVCTSTFITNAWFIYLAHPDQNNKISYRDFRWLGSSTFQALNSLCQLVHQTILDSRQQFLYNQYISITVTSRNLFEFQLRTFVQQLKSSITNNFVFSLDLVRNSTHTNGLYSALDTNYRLFLVVSNTFIESGPIMYPKNCPCEVSPTCSGPLAIYNFSDSTPVFVVPGMHRACYIIEALLQSTLECFYNHACLQRLQSYILSEVPIGITPLNAALKSSYSINSTIKQLLDQLMIEEWTWSSHYEQYYNHCRPVDCKYSYKSTNSVIYIVTASIGLLGGLVTVLKVMIPLLVQLQQELNFKRSHQNPSSDMQWRRDITK